MWQRIFIRYEPAGCMTFILLIAKMKNKKKEDIHTGAYAVYQGKKGINERDQIAFSRQMVKILNYGGMMSFDVVYALDHEIGLLRPAKLYPGGKTVFYYNYFEDESWELAEYDSKTCSLWTEKVGEWRICGCCAGCIHAVLHLR